MVLLDDVAGAARVSIAHALVRAYGPRYEIQNDLASSLERVDMCRRVIGVPLKDHEPESFESEDGRH